MNFVTKNPVFLLLRNRNELTRVVYKKAYDPSRAGRRQYPTPTIQHQHPQNHNFTNHRVCTYTKTNNLKYKNTQ